MINCIFFFQNTANISLDYKYKLSPQTQAINLNLYQILLICVLYNLILGSLLFITDRWDSAKLLLAT